MTKKTASTISGAAGGMLGFGAYLLLGRQMELSHLNQLLAAGAAGGLAAAAIGKALGPSCRTPEDPDLKDAK